MAGVVARNPGGPPILRNDGVFRPLRGCEGIGPLQGRGAMTFACADFAVWRAGRTRRGGRTLQPTRSERGKLLYGA